MRVVSILATLVPWLGAGAACLSGLREGPRQETGFIFVSELGPGEGRGRLIAKAPKLVLRVDAGQWTQLATTLQMAPGARILFDMERYGTVRPSIVTAQQPGELTARSFGAVRYLPEAQYYDMTLPWRTFAYDSGSTLEYLQYRAEGECLVRRASEVLEVENCPWLDANSPSSFTVDWPEPITEWWVRVINDERTPLGWLLIDKRVVEFAR